MMRRGVARESMGVVTRDSINTTFSGVPPTQRKCHVKVANQPHCDLIIVRKNADWDATPQSLRTLSR